MMTNVIAYLCTSLAYQSAVMQLMVAQANFSAQQLSLRESLPITAPANTNTWNVAMPPDGVAGSLTTSNYVFQFTAGRLTSIQIKRLPHDPAVVQPSLINTNGACQLARQWLAALSVDVPALDSKCAPTVQRLGAGSATSTRVRGRHPDHDRQGAGETNLIPRAPASRAAPPLFRVNWGGGRGQPPLQASVEILGSTRQCLGLHVLDASLFKAPPLQVTNAAALLGPPPSPRQLVADFLGGTAAYDTVAQPDQVLVWLLGAQPDNPNSQTNRTPALPLAAPIAAALARTLTNFDSYAWLQVSDCVPDYGVRLRFTRSASTVDFAWDYECNHLEVTHKARTAEMNCPAARAALVKAVQSAFPNDEMIKALSP